MSVEFTKNQRNNAVACNGGYLYSFVKIKVIKFVCF